MIEWIQAESGEKVIRCDGRLLASRYNPGQEAYDWLARRRAFVSSVKTVFVLGAGSGFHIRSVAQATDAQIFVIELRKDLVEAVCPLLSEFKDRIHFVSARTTRDVRANEDVRKGLQNSFVVLEHPASVHLDIESYKDISAWLRARDWGPLNWQWKLKGLSPLDSNPKVLVSEKPLTILDLDDCDLVKNGVERERLLLMALRELVK